MNCKFCGYEKEEIIYENEKVYVIPDKYPIITGHLLVIPKRHYTNIIEIPDDILCEIMKTIKKMEKILVEHMEIKGITIKQNWTPFLEENKLIVRHIHFHIIPREYKDKLSKGTERINMGYEERVKIAKMIRKYIKD